MCECIDYEDGAMHLCAVCADLYRNPTHAGRRPPLPANVAEAVGVIRGLSGKYLHEEGAQVGIPVQYLRAILEHFKELHDEN